MNLASVAKRAGVVTGVAAGVVGAVYAGERAVAARIRRGGRDDLAENDPLVPEFDRAIRIDCHDGGELHVIERAPDDVSDAPPIVLLHGITLSSRVWARQFTSLPEAGFRTIAIDGRGHGESTVGDTGHSIANLAADLGGVLTTLDLRDVVLVGHSMGGMAVQAFAVHQPEVLEERVSGLVLLSTSPRAFVSDAHRTRRGLERAAGWVPDLGAVMRQRNLGLLVARLGFGDDPDPRCVEATRQMLGQCSRETIREAGRALLEFDVTSQLPDIDVPTLVVVGSADLITSPRDARQIADLVPRARLVEMPRAGHMLMYERTAELDDLLVTFARECLDLAQARRSGTSPALRSVAR